MTIVVTVAVAMPNEPADLADLTVPNWMAKTRVERGTRGHPEYPLAASRARTIISMALVIVVTFVVTVPMVVPSANVPAVVADLTVPICMALVVVTIVVTVSMVMPNVPSAIADLTVPICMALACVERQLRSNHLGYQDCLLLRERNGVVNLPDMLHDGLGNLLVCKRGFEWLAQAAYQSLSHGLGASAPIPRPEGQGGRTAQ